MAPNEFIGRDKEAAALRKSYSSEKSKFVAVYGRKGVGKTSLVRNILGDRLDFEFTASCGITQRLQRRRFQNALDLKTGSRGKVPADWFAAFDRLKDYLPSLGRERAVVLLDGLPSMDAPKSLFISALSYFWNGWHSESTLLKLYVCGSDGAWMTDRLIGDPGGLYGRISRQIRLAPFSLRETDEYLTRIKGIN